MFLSEMREYGLWNFGFDRGQPAKGMIVTGYNRWIFTGPRIQLPAEEIRESKNAHHHIASKLLSYPWDQNGNN